MKELCPFPCRASTRDSSPIFIARSLVQQRHALLGVAGPCVTEQTPPCGIATAHRARLSWQAPEGRGRSERACGSALQRQAAALARPATLFPPGRGPMWLRSEPRDTKATCGMRECPRCLFRGLLSTTRWRNLKVIFYSVRPLF